MTRRWMVSAAIVVLMASPACATSGCQDGDAPSPQVSKSSRPFPGWVPQPPATLQTYANCLKRAGVDVARVIGMYIVVKPTSAGTLARANGDCDTERKAHQATITTKDFKIPDEDGYRFVTQVRSCLSGKGAAVPAEDEPVFLLTNERLRAAAFDNCVEEIRALPTPSEF